MNLEELQTARDRERQTDKLQQLRESFYSDAGEFIQQLRTERDRAAERADDPFDAPEVNQLTDEINTAEQTVEAIYEKRVGKIVKAASFAAADLPAEADGMTAEEQELFDTLVGNIKQNRQHVLDVLAGEEPDSSPVQSDAPTANSPEPQSASPHSSDPPSQSMDDPSAAQPTEQTAETNVSAADLMAGGEETDTQREPPTPPTPPTEPPSSESPEPDASTGQPTPASPGPDSGTTDTEQPGTQPIENGTTEKAATQNNQASGQVPSEREPAPANQDVPSEEAKTAPKAAGSEQAADLRNDGGQPRAQSSTAPTGQQTTSSPTAESTTSPATQQTVERQTVRVTDDIETFVGPDERDYDLEQNDIVTLPEPNASLLIDRDAAERL